MINDATKNSVTHAPQTGRTTIAMLKDITPLQLQAGIDAGRRLTEQGQHEAAADVLGCLALYDPYRPEVWKALEELFRRERLPKQANVFASLARAMAA